MSKIRRAIAFLLILNKKIEQDSVFDGAAALAFYLTLALFPALTLVMTLIPYLPVDNVDQELMAALSRALPAQASELVAEVVQDVTANKRGGLLSFSVLGTLWATSAGMYAVMRQLNVIFHATERRSFIKARVVAITLSLMFGVLVISAFTLIVVGNSLENWLSAYAGWADIVLVGFSMFRWVVIAALLLFGFALVYRYAPHVEHKFAFFTLGAAVGVTLLIIASVAFTFYAANFANYNATYGSIGAVVSLMFWLFLCGLVLLIGAEINMQLRCDAKP